ncbi:MAG: 50S ribosomal protein L1 [Proteobacteria bacterium]|nr:50S ribosomal protein L1 [Pseudomonadota bacterium]
MVKKTGKKSGKKYLNALTRIARGKLYDLDSALELLKHCAYANFDNTVEIAVNLGLDPRHADQNIRGAVPLPFGRGKTVRIVVFAKGDKALEVSNMGVEAVGGQDLADKVQKGWLEFDQAIATPDMMGIVGKLGRILGPRGLMPNPKLGTVTHNVVQAVNELQAGRAEFRVDKAGIVHVPVGKMSMTTEALKGNILAIMEALERAKPQSAKGTYVKKICLSATMSPGIKLDPSSLGAA